MHVDQMRLQFFKISPEAFSRGTSLSSQFFRFFEIRLFCFAVARFDLVHDVEAIFYFP